MSSKTIWKPANTKFTDLSSYADASYRSYDQWAETTTNLALLWSIPICKLRMRLVVHNANGRCLKDLITKVVYPLYARRFFTSAYLPYRVTFSNCYAFMLYGQPILTLDQYGPSLLAQVRTTKVNRYKSGFVKWKHHIYSLVYLPIRDCATAIISPAVVVFALWLVHFVQCISSNLVHVVFSSKP